MNIRFRARTFNIIAFNVLLAIDPGEENHLTEICELHNINPDTISTIRWAKPTNRRSPNQTSAHLILALNSASAANTAITNGLNICNK